MLFAISIKFAVHSQETVELWWPIFRTKVECDYFADLFARLVVGQLHGAVEFAKCLPVGP